MFHWQGGPGGSSTGFGNFIEIGPLDVNLKPRDTTWLSQVSLLFIDNPVGTGYSYTTSESAFSKTNDQIARDLVSVMKAFYKELPEFDKIPLYVFSESYGGKMAVEFVKLLYTAIKEKEVNCNLKGFAMGDSWISPMDSVLTWGPYLFSTSLVDEYGLNKINQSAVRTNAAALAGNWTQSTALWSLTEDIVEANAAGVNFYNILKWGADDNVKKALKSAKTPLQKRYTRHVKVHANDSLSDLMNGPIRKKLGVIPSNVTWGSQSQDVFAALAGDFNKPVTDLVDEMLNTDLKVVVYSGQLDLIVDTVGTEKWVQKLKWNGLSGYNAAPRKVIQDKETNLPVAFVKEYKNFSFYWILDAGHMVPADAGKTALQMVSMVTQPSY